jgi:hypothetical protein
MNVVPCKKSDCTNVTSFLGVDDVIALAKKNNEHPVAGGRYRSTKVFQSG